ncbi:MAG: hypothetical protein LUF28_08815 [Clostridiales bacterium]|nr:hypothetical protein [Clostridiales bacterium]
MEEQKKLENEKEYIEKAQKFAGSAKSAFITAWTRISSVLEEWFGIDANTARSTMLVSIIPICLFIGQIASYAYFWVHYFVIYKVPMAYFAIDDSLLAKFMTGVWITLIVIVGILFVYYFEVIRTYSREVVSVGVAVIAILFISTAYVRLWSFKSICWFFLAFIVIMITVLLFASRVKCAPHEIEQIILRDGSNPSEEEKI